MLTDRDVEIIAEAAHAAAYGLGVYAAERPMRVPPPSGPVLQVLCQFVRNFVERGMSAEENHETLVAEMKRDGWIASAESSVREKKSPHMVPWAEVPLFSRQEDELFRQVALVMAKAIEEVKASNPEPPMAIDKAALLERGNRVVQSIGRVFDYLQCPGTSDLIFAAARVVRAMEGIAIARLSSAAPDREPDAVAEAEYALATFDRMRGLLEPVVVLRPAQGGAS